MDNTGGLRPDYHTYPRQRCFVGHSHEAAWRDDLLAACAEALPPFGLEPWYAADHFDPTHPLREKVAQAIANARYGIYDLSSWQDQQGAWHMPRNVLIELGMAIALNRPALLLRHSSNAGLPLPVYLEGVALLEFAGEATLKRALERRLPQWLDAPPERDWLNRFCIFGGRVCGFREAHPRARQWGGQPLRCHLADGLDRSHPRFQPADRDEIRAVFEDVFGMYASLAFDYLDELPLTEGYQFTLCGGCQTVRSSPFAIYRITPHTPADVFIAIGMSIALETLFEYDIPKVLLVQREEQLPSLLRGYEVVEAPNASAAKKKLKVFLPAVVRKAREAAWKPRLLPFIELVTVPEADIVVPGDTGPQEEPAEIRTPRILVVDDEPAIREIMVDIFSDEDYDILTAENGQEAVNLCERQHFDLVIMDVMMPVLDGLEATRRIRARSDIPVVLMSAQRDLAQGAASVGAADYFSKPFDLDELRLRVESILRRRENGHPAEVDRQEEALEQQVDINAADLETLAKLPGIGRLLARKIMNYRAQLGPFSTIEDLSIVQGIGRARLNRIRAYIKVSDVTIPPDDVVEASAGGDAGQQQDSAPRSGAPCILVADDDKAVRQLLELVLREQEYEVLIAQDGAQLVQMAQEQRPNLVLTDLMMPTMDGYEAIRQLRADPRTATVPILIVTAKSAPDDLVTGFEIGADDYIAKPFNIPELLARIKRQLRRTANHQ